MKLIPSEAKNCPFMKKAGIKLTNKNWMKNIDENQTLPGWKRVLNAVESGKMPPTGMENIWT
jgi:hypothetical protein